MLGERGRKNQPCIGHEAEVVEGDTETARTGSGERVDAKSALYSNRLRSISPTCSSVGSATNSKPNAVTLSVAVAFQYMLRGMKKPVLVLVSGASGTGKTVLARRLAASLPVVVLEKDAIKETLFDALGGGDRDWSRKLGTAAFELLRVLVDSHLRAGQSVVVEANFQLSFEAPWIARVRSEYDVNVLELHCHTDLGNSAPTGLSPG